MNYKFGLLAIIAAHVCATSAGPATCACTRNLRPVCGSDGVTYNNECLLRCERSKINGDLTVTKEGPCEENAEPDNCICTLEYRPVCATDGNTYPNECSMRCQQSSTPSLRVNHEGECKEEEVKVVDLPACICTREMKPVCGSDGATYNNPCLLNCATQANPGLSVDHAGPCDHSVKVVEQPYSDNPSCACTRNLEPVCASDGITYNNECLMRCKGGNDLTVVKHEPCEY